MLQSMIAQYRAIREDIGLIDRSEVGKLAIVGADRYTWLQGMVSNDVRLLTRPRQDAADTTNRNLQACILSATGHVLTDLTLIDVTGAQEMATALGLAAPDFVLLDLPRINLDKIATLLDRFLITEDVEIVDVSDALACLSLQGPIAQERSQSGKWDDLFHDFVGERIVIRADHTGSGGSDHYFVCASMPVWPSAIAGITVVEPETQELLRIEAGIPKYGADMDETVIALEANLGPTHISLNKGCYMGQEIIARIDSRGHTNRALTGLLFAEGEIPQPGDKIYAPNNNAEPGRETGRITSVAAASPALHGRPIALGYVRHEHREPGATLLVGEGGEWAVVGCISPLPTPYSPLTSSYGV
jgi:folate-binding protein YgfZ